jgi:hypothetical protein
MKVQDLQKTTQGFGSEKQPYEPPTAILVPVQLEERVLGCNYTTTTLCNYTN